MGLLSGKDGQRGQKLRAGLRDEKTNLGVLIWETQQLRAAQERTNALLEQLVAQGAAPSALAAPQPGWGPRHPGPRHGG